MNQLHSNARWLAAGQLAKVAIQLTSITVLARLLEPKYYGIMAISSSMTAFAGLFRDLGTNAALIQAKTVDEEMKGTAFWTTAAMGSILAVILVAIASPASAYFKEPDLFWVMILVALSFPVSALGVVHATMLEREGRYRELTFLEVGTQGAALVIAASLALAGFGVFSLAAPALLTSVISTTYLLRTHRWRPAAKLRVEALKRFAKFSGNLTGFNLINYFSRNSDSLIIGRLLGSAPLGVYATAMKLMLFPLQSITHVSSRALFPVLSQAQDQPETFAKLYGQTIGFVSLLTFPLMTGLWVCRSEFVAVVYGNKWLGLIELIAWLAPVGLLQSVLSTAGTVFMARNKTDWLMRVGVASAVLQVGAFLVGAHWGIVELVQLYLLANAVLFVPIMMITMHLAFSRPMAWLRPLLPAGGSSLVMACACLMVKFAFPPGMGKPLALAVLVAVGAAVYAAMLRIAFASAWQQLLNGLRRKRD